MIIKVKFSDFQLLSFLPHPFFIVGNFDGEYPVFLVKMIGTQRELMWYAVRPGFNSLGGCDTQKLWPSFNGHSAAEKAFTMVLAFLSIIGLSKFEGNIFVSCYIFEEEKKIL